MNRSPDPEPPRAGAALPDPVWSLREGDLVFGRFRLGRRVTADGFFLERLGVDERLDRLVAIRFLLNTQRRDAQAVKRQRDGIRAAMNLSHPSLVRIHDLYEDAGAGLAAIVMEHVRGATLSELKEGQPGECFNPEELLPWLRELCEALEHLHAHGIAHGALSPSALMVDERRRLKLVPPLGGSRTAASLTCDGMVPGNPAYMSPQQIRGDAAAPADDIYALGAIVYELLTSAPPFGGPIVTLLHRALTEPARSMAAAREELGITGRPPIPRAWEETIAACLGKEPRERPSSAGEVAARLSGIAPPETLGPIHLVREAGSVKPATEPAVPPPASLQFTAFQPPKITPAQWRKMLVFAHLESLPADADPQQEEPLEEMLREARARLGPEVDTFPRRTEDSQVAIPLDSEITFVPKAQGVAFNPPRRSFLWCDGMTVHAEEFLVRAGADSPPGAPVRGTVTVFLGSLIIAEIALRFQVEAASARSKPASEAPPNTSQKGRTYRRIFASYSHRDLQVVEQMDRFARTLGDEYLRDWVHLRSGEVWEERLRELIEQADVFQLFWSTNSAQSKYVRQEWQHALSLSRDSFLRPVYWEEPWPSPPPELRRFHFERLSVTGPARPTTSPAASRSPASFMPGSPPCSAPCTTRSPARGRSALLGAFVALVMLGGLALLFYYQSARREREIVRTQEIPPIPVTPQPREPSRYAVDPGQRSPLSPIAATPSPPVSVAHPPVSPAQLDVTQFRVTSVLVGTPSLAVINGRPYSEGEFVRVERTTGAPTPARLRVARIHERGVELEVEGDGTRVMVPLTRREAAPELPVGPALER